MKRIGRLKPGREFTWSWRRGDEPAGSIGITVSDSWVVLRYTWTPYGYEPRDIRCSLAIQRTPCYFGNTRPWFVCPDCRQPCAIVYGLSPRGMFACRACMRLGYQSESESVVDRCWRAQRKLEAKLTDEGGRPKWMRQRTFDRINQKWELLEERKDAAWAVGFAALVRRLGMTPEEVLS